MSYKPCNVFLLELNGAFPITRYSPGSKQRAVAIYRYLKNTGFFNNDDNDIKSILILSKKEWRICSSLRYGLPTSKVSKSTVTLLVPASYSPRYLQRFEQYILNSANIKMTAFGEFHEFLDSLILFEAIRATTSKRNIDSQQLSKRSAKLFWETLSQSEMTDLSTRAATWVKIFDKNYDASFLNMSRNKLAPQNRLSLDCHYLAQALY